MHITKTENEWVLQISWDLVKHPQNTPTETFSLHKYLSHRSHWVLVIGLFNPKNAELVSALRPFPCFCLEWSSLTSAHGLSLLILIPGEIPHPPRGLPWPSTIEEPQSLSVPVSHFCLFIVLCHLNVYSTVVSKLSQLLFSMDVNSVRVGSLSLLLTAVFLIPRIYVASTQLIEYI